MTIQPPKTTNDPKGFYALLGIPDDATDEEIKKAYRRESKKHHPDTGGDKESFSALAHAYAVLSDPEARAEYNRGEYREQGATPREMAEKQLGIIFEKACEEINPKDVPAFDLLAAMRKGCDEIEGNINDADLKMPQMIEKLQQISKRMLGNETLSRYLVVHEAKIREQILALRYERRVLAEMRLLLAPGEYKSDPIFHRGSVYESMMRSSMASNSKDWFNDSRMGI